jgi:hypothetical protein
MEAQPLRFHKTEGANNHIEQGYTLFFAHHPIGVTYNRLPTMLTNAIHFSSKWQGICHARIILSGTKKLYVTRDFYRAPK